MTRWLPVLALACAAPVLFLVRTDSAAAPEQPAVEAPKKATFANDVRPVVAKYCLSCHNADKKRGNLNLEPFKDEASALLLGQMKR